MKKIIYLMAVVVCQMVAMTAAAQNLSGKWLMENTAENMGEGIGIHVSGMFDFDDNGAVEARYRVITTMAQPEYVDSKVKSVYIDLLIDGTGIYGISDGTIHVNLDKMENCSRVGEGTYDNMGPEFKDKDPKGQEIFNSFVGVFVKLASAGFKDVDITDIIISETTIEGGMKSLLMNSRVTLTKID